MSSIGKRITDVLTRLPGARAVSSREYEIQDARGKGTGTRVREQALDLNGDGVADVRAERFTDQRTGRFSDSFEVENSLMVQHERVIFRADSSGVVRSEYHADRLASGQYGRQVNLGDSDGDGRVDFKSISVPGQDYVEQDDTDHDGVLDRERTVGKDGKLIERKIALGDFFADED